MVSNFDTILFALKSNAPPRGESAYFMVHGPGHGGLTRSTHSNIFKAEKRTENTRLLQVMCKPPVWCVYSTPHRRFITNLEENILGLV